MEIDSTRPCFYWWGQLPSCPRILLAFHRLAFGLQLDESPTITLRISWGKKDFILKLEPQQGMELPVSLAPRQRMQASKVLSSRLVEESPIELAEPVSPFSGPPEHQVPEAAWLRHWCCCELTEVPPRRIGAHVWDCGTTRISTDVTLLGPQESGYENQREHQWHTPVTVTKSLMRELLIPGQAIRECGKAREETSRKICWIDTVQEE